MGWVLFGALLIGLTLGMLGSGGSAITVPVLVYLVGHGTKESIAESMAIVGLISVAAAIPYARARQIDWRSVWYFGIPGMLGTFIGAWLGGIASGALQLLVFAGVLFLAAAMMLRKTKGAGGNHEEVDPNHRSAIWIVMIEGLVVGTVTGFVGVGGGFLIVPALVVLGKLSMRLAIGTSLVIIAIKAAVGFAKYEHYLIHHDLSVDVSTIVLFTSLGIAGSLIGRSINRRLNQLVLRQVFAGFLIILGGFVIIQESSKLLNSRPTSKATSQESNTYVARAQSVIRTSRVEPDSLGDSPIRRDRMLGTAPPSSRSVSCDERHGQHGQH